LSNGTGQVLVRWHKASNGRSSDKLVLDWREVGGPPVLAPDRSGYGASVIRDLIPHELGGAGRYELPREGARCTLEIPAKWLRRSVVVGARSQFQRESPACHPEAADQARPARGSTISDSEWLPASTSL